MPMKELQPGEVHEAFRQEVLAVMRKYGRDLRADEMLALVSNVVGMMLAYMDASKYTPQTGMEIILRNIEIGNQQVIRQLETLATSKPAGSA